jgi:hypothetical protein
VRLGPRIERLQNRNQRLTAVGTQGCAADRGASRAKWCGNDRRLAVPPMPPGANAGIDRALRAGVGCTDLGVQIGGAGLLNRVQFLLYAAPYGKSSHYDKTLPAASRMLWHRFSADRMR